jgi:hypothetical protein
MSDDKVSTALAVDKYMNKRKSSPSAQYAANLKSLHRDWSGDVASLRRRSQKKFSSRRSSKT